MKTLNTLDRKKMFNIRVVRGEKTRIDSFDYAYGLIKIEDFQKELLLPLGYWNEEDYECHWNDQISKFLDQHLDRTFLVTGIFDPKISAPEYTKSIEWWTFYRLEDFVAIQTGFLSLPEIDSEFTIESGGKFVTDREIYFEDEKISEWKTSLVALQEFQERIKG